MPDKDFLSQFSDSNKPESFQEEERIPVVKEKKKINPLLPAIALALLLIIGVLLYFLFLAPKISVPDFVGKNKSDVAAWVRQQGIEASGILFDEIHDFETEEGTILSQNIPAGKKVRKDVKMNFVLSLGPDPDEAIKVPDLSDMTKAEIQEWISKNKLSKTKVVTAYSESVEEDGVIDYSFSGCDEDSFTRACSLKINVSKGPAPAGKVTVEDFEKKMYETVEAWAKSKKIELTKSESYSDKVEAGYVISQSVESGKTLNEGDTLHVVVSLGKAVSVPNLKGWSLKEIQNWCRKNNIVLDAEEYDYDSSAYGTCISQTPRSGSVLKEGDYLTIIVSKGDPKLSDFNGDTLSDLKAWIKEVNIDSGDLSLNVSYQFSDTVPMDHIIKITPSNLRVGSVVNAVISDGRNILLKPEGLLSWTTLAQNPNSFSEEDARQLCEANEGVSCVIVYKKDSTLANATVIKAVRSDGKKLADNTYLPQRETITITVNDKGE